MTRQLHAAVPTSETPGCRLQRQNIQMRDLCHPIEFLRSTAMRLNHARELLQRFDHLPDAVAQMRKDSGLSRRQAYRYLQQAAHLKQPLLVGDTKIAFTVKLSQALVRRLRAFATAQIVVERDRESGITCGFAAEKKTWLNGLHSTATCFNSNIASIGCSLKKSSKPTNFSCLPTSTDWICGIKSVAGDSK